MAPDEHFALPTFVITPADARRLKHELEALDNALEQARLRGVGEQQTSEPVSFALKELSAINKRDMTNASDRQLLRRHLSAIITTAPVLRFSFATSPSSEAMVRIMTWLRAEVHPLALARIGLQPSLAAGFILKTPNHYYDFSLRKHLDAQKPLLLQALHAVGSHE